MYAYYIFAISNWIFKVLLALVFCTVPSTLAFLPPFRPI